MLRIYTASERQFSKMENFVYFPMSTFNVTFQDKWFQEPFGRRVLKEIERKNVDDADNVVDALLFKYRMRPREISTGSKNLFICKHFDLINRFAMMGENCHPILLELADEKDVSIGIETFARFADGLVEEHPVYFVSIDEVVDSTDRFNTIMLDLNDEGCFDA